MKIERLTSYWVILLCAPLIPVVVLYILFGNQNYFGLQGFVKGLVATGPVAAYVYLVYLGWSIYEKLANLMESFSQTQDSIQHIRHIEGYWLQKITDLPDCPYSIGKFTYNKSSNTFRWNGTNYTDMGKEVATWKSIHIHFDPKENQILYIFRGEVGPTIMFRGFGVMNLQEIEGMGLVPISGYFQDAQRDASPKAFTMKKLEDVMDMLDVAQDKRGLDDHEDILRLYHEQFKDA